MIGVKGSISRRGAFLRFSCLVLAVIFAIGSRCSDDPTGADLPGTISVIVTSSVPVGAAATVRLTGSASFQERTATTNFGTALTFAEVPPGTYSLTTTVFGFTCHSVTATVEGLETVTVSITCTRLSGTVTGTVTSGGAPIQGATVELTGTGILPRTLITGTGGGFTFGALAGEYVLTARHVHNNCPVQTVLIAADQTTTADLSCTPKTTGLIVGTVHASGDPGFEIGGATVRLSGPVSGTATWETPSGSGFFQFDELPPGTYTVTATAINWFCPSVTAEVSAAHTTTVLVSCTVQNPTGAQIAGNWQYSVQVLSAPVGSCPPPLPASGTGSMIFHPGNNTIEIIGLDPQMAILGFYDEEHGFSHGSGSVVLGDGSSIRTDVGISFFVDFAFGDVGFFTDFGFGDFGVWTREHRDPSGNLFCTEVYQAGGFKVD